MKKNRRKIKEIIIELKKGKMVIIVDDNSRENEGDIALAAEKTTPQKINFIIKQCRGLVCVAMEKLRLKELELPQMVKKNQDLRKTKFSISVDAWMCKTGISAFERAKTIKLLSSPYSTKRDFKRPGHVFPLECERGGVLRRPGHTEAIIELLKIAEMQPVGVICEIIKENGKMARKKDILAFSQEFNCKIIEIKDIIAYKKNCLNTMLL